MKNLIFIFLFFGIAMLYVGCSDNSPSGLDNNTLNKKGVKDVYTYKLEPRYEKLPDAHGVIKIQMIKEGVYSYDLKAFSLEPRSEYYLKAYNIGLPTPFVCPYTISDEDLGVTDKNGNLKMSGVLNLKNGYTITLFRTEDKVTAPCVFVVLEIEKPFSDK